MQLTRTRAFLTAFTWTLAFLMGLLAGGFLRLQYGIPRPAELQDYHPMISTRLLDRTGQLIADFSQQRRELVSLDAIPGYIKDGVVAVEDKRFYHHWGIDIIRLFGMTFYNLKHMRVAQGGSTITQQLARNMFLNMEQTLERKLKEALLAIEIERSFAKDEILELYLNEVYFGHGAYGVQTAAQTFFGKPAQDLNLAQCATLSALPANPVIYSPYEHPDRCTRRRNLFLKKLLLMHKIRPEDYQAALAQTIKPVPRLLRQNEAPYFVEEIRKYLEATYGPEFIYTSGATIYTTLDLKIQRAANTACTTSLKVLDSLAKLRNREYRQTKKEYDVLASIRGSNHGPGDSTLKPDYLQCAALAVDPKNGAIRAMVGGRSFNQSYFNRATQALRQPGSAFKVFVYTAAIDNGRSPDDLEDDAPLRLTLPSGGKPYEPQNIDRKYLGPIDLYTALAKSRNVVAVRLISEIGPEVVVNYARRMGINENLKPVYALALGACEVTLLEMTSAFGVLCNDGVRVAPRYINRIVERSGRILEEQRPREEAVLSEQTSQTMVQMMQGVVDQGTAYSVRTSGFQRPAAGKTGTTDDYADAWFVGFTPELAAGVWVGYDARRTIYRSATGGVLCAPIWAKIMRASTPPAIDAFSFAVDEWTPPVSVSPDTGAHPGDTSAQTRPPSEQPPKPPPAAVEGY
jgi:penicillin-binding protein 1A